MCVLLLPFPSPPPPPPSSYLPSLSRLLMVWKSIGLLITRKYSGNFLLRTGSRNGPASSCCSRARNIWRQMAMSSNGFCGRFLDGEGAPPLERPRGGCWERREEDFAIVPSETQDTPDNAIRITPTYLLAFVALPGE